MKFNPAPERVLARPTQFGPTTRTPGAVREFDQALLRVDALRFCGFRKTRGIDNDATGLDAAAASIMPSTIGRATQSTTQSGLSGSSASDGTQGRPSRVWYFGLIPNTLPVNADMLDERAFAERALAFPRRRRSRQPWD